eukprot:6211204-Pleurochrysis_carterae.AAC.1
MVVTLAGTLIGLSCGATSRWRSRSSEVLIFCAAAARMALSLSCAHEAASACSAEAASGSMDAHWPVSVSPSCARSFGRPCSSICVKMRAEDASAKTEAW